MEFTIGTIVLIGITFGAALVNGAIGYGFSSLTVPIALLFLTNRLLKFRITGTLRSPSVQIDPTVVVSTAAVGFFGGILKLPAEVLR